MSYSHLSVEERYAINHMHMAHRTQTAIALHLGRSKSTISRELRRNAAFAPGTYWNCRAQELAKARRAAPLTPYKFCPDPLLDAVKTALANRHSPEEISGRLKYDYPDTPTMHISTEAIYLWVYRQGEPMWNWLLRKQHRRRTPRRRGKASKKGQIIGRIGIEHRPVEVAQRTRLGDWESDTLCGEPGTGAVATHVERLSRLVVAAKVQDRSATELVRQSLRAFKKAGVTQASCLTLTADNGKEFAQFMKLEKGLGLKVYFANPHAPWERGTNENTNGLIREYFPKGTDFRKITQVQVDSMVRSMNNRPRKCLGYQTPREIFEKLAGVALQI